MSVRAPTWFLLATTLVLSSCGGEPVDAAVEPARPVKTFMVGSANQQVTREWPGRVEPAQNAEMSFNVAGELKDLPVTEGMQVKRGQVLAKIDARQLRARLDSEEAQLKFNEQEFARKQTLVERGSVAVAELDRRTQAMAVAKAAVADAKKALADATMKAPFAGTIAKVMVDNFQSVQAKQTVLVLQDASTLEVVTHLSQRDYAAAKPNLTIDERNERLVGRVHVVIDTLGDLKIPATLKEVATVPDMVTGTYEVTWGFDPPPDTMITPGMTAKLVVDPEVVDADTPVPLFVPIQAVVGADDGGSHIWVLDADLTAKAVPVKTGVMVGDSVEILDGLKGGELIATTGVHALRDGLVVTRFEDVYDDIQRAR